MRIGLISYEYPPYPGGGIATYVANAARSLAAAGHEVHVITNAAAFGSTAPTDRVGVHAHGGFVTHRLDLFDESYAMPPDVEALGRRVADVRGRASAWARDPSTRAGLVMADYVRELHARAPFDVVEVSDMFAEGFFMARRRLCGRRDEWPPVTVLGHTSSRETYRTAGDAWQLGGLGQRQRAQREDACMEEADGLQTPSASLMRRYEDWFGARLPRHRAVVPNFFDAPASIAAVAPPAGDAPRSLLVIGRVEPRKGSDTALRAFAGLLREFPDLELRFLGETGHWWPGESFEELVRAWIPAADRARVRFLGLLPREHVFAAAAAATLVLHPCRWDNWPNAVLEAMSVGACCVVSDHGGQAEMVQGVGVGEVFPAGDPAALAAVIRSLLRDAPRRRALGAAAKARLLELTDPERILAAKLAHFRAIAAPQPSPAIRTVHVVLDADGAAAEHVAVSREALRAVFPAGRPGAIDVAIADVGGGFAGWTPNDAVPWREAGDDDVLLWVRAGAVPSPRALDEVVRLACHDDGAGGAFLWLASHEPSQFPFAADLTTHDLVLVGACVPTVVATTVRRLRRCVSLAGVHGGAARAAVVAAAIHAASGRPLRHTGDLGGHDLRGPVMVDSDTQVALVGWLELHGCLDVGAIAFGAHCDAAAPDGEDPARAVLGELRARLARCPWPWLRQCGRLLRRLRQRLARRRRGP